MDSPRLSQIAGGFAGKRILVIGDLMLDEFQWGQVTRISPEAPVPVVQVTSETYYPGGAANVARNVREFTEATLLMGITGTDPAGDRLMELLDRGGVGTAAVQRDVERTTTAKTRVIARNQQIVRVDRERKSPLTARQADTAVAALNAIIADLDGIIVADYGKGFLTQPFADAICDIASRGGIVLAVDPHPHTSIVWRGATVIKPNRAEALLAAGIPGAIEDPADRGKAILDAGQRLLQIWQPRSLLITLGEQGMMLFEEGRAPYHTPTRAKAVFDVSGAGDTAISILTLGLCAGATLQEAAELANIASGIVVGKLGTATVTMDELEAGIAAS